MLSFISHQIELYPIQMIAPSSVRSASEIEPPQARRSPRESRNRTEQQVAATATATAHLYLSTAKQIQAAWGPLGRNLI